MNEIDEFEFEAQEQPEEAFHVEVDLYESGDYVNLLIVPCNDTFIVVAGDEHLCTLQKTCAEPECWEQQDGSLEDDMVERLGAAITGYTNYTS